MAYQRISKKPARLLALLVLGCATMASAQDQVAQSAAEVQLESIREAIIKAAMDQPTQVLSTSWIDQDGRLHETAHFQTDGEVRGISLSTYRFEKPQAKPKPVQVKVDFMPSAWRQKMQAGADCPAPARKLRQPLKIFSEAGPGLGGAQQYHSQSLLQAVQNLWRETVQRSDRWWPQTLDSQQANAYETRLTAQATTESAWAVRLSLSALPPTQLPQEPWYERLKAKLDFTSPPAGTPWLWQLTMSMGTLGHDGTFEPQWNQHKQLTIETPQQQATPQVWMAAIGDKLGPILQEWTQAMDKAWACEPVQFQVSSPPGSGLQINAGKRSGLQAGDRLLLVAPEYIPQKILENGAMAHLRLAEVVQVGQYQTAIRQLAGPPASTHGRWLALPL